MSAGRWTVVGRPADGCRRRRKKNHLKCALHCSKLNSGRKRRYRRIIGTVDGCRTAGGWSSAAPVSSVAPKKKAFDRGGPIWPPQSNAKDDQAGFLESGEAWSQCPERTVSLAYGFDRLRLRHFFWLGGAAPQTPRFLAGGAKPPQTLPLNGRSSHLIEAAKRGRLDQMIFFSAPLTTRTPRR